MSDAVASVSLENDIEFDRKGDALVWGVPLAQGVVHDADTLALRVAGKTLPTQADALARWDDGSVKWALLTVAKLGDVPSGRTAAEVITRRPSRAKGLVVRKTSAGVRVDTGKLRFTIAASGPIVKRFDTLRGKQWKQRAASLDLSMTIEHPAGRVTYRASDEIDTRSIDIESHGPHRAVVCVRGTHRSASGETFGPYTLRFEIVAGRADLRLTHSFIFDGDPFADFVRASEVLLTAKVGSKDQRFGFGGDDGRTVAC